MIITMSLLGILIAGIIILVVNGLDWKYARKCRDKYRQCVRTGDNENAKIWYTEMENHGNYEWPNYVGGALTIVGALFGIGCSIACLANNFSTQAKTDYIYLTETYEVLEYRLDLVPENFTGNELVFRDILEYNKRVREAQAALENPMINWFINYRYENLKLIEVNINVE